MDGIYVSLGSASAPLRHLKKKSKNDLSADVIYYAFRINMDHIPQPISNTLVNFGLA